MRVTVPKITALALAMTLAMASNLQAHEQREIKKEGNVAPEIEKALRAAFPATRIDRIIPSEFPGLYELHMGKNVAYSTPAGRYLLIGHIYDTTADVDLSQNRLDAYTTQKAEWSALPLAAAVRHGAPGGVKVAVFTDPDCGYCRKLAAMMPEVEGVEWYELLYPLASLHPEAPAKAGAILCHPDRPAALRAALTGQPLPAATPVSPCNPQVALRQVEAAAKQLNVFGTPTLVREDGVILKGALESPAALQAWARGAGRAKP